MPTSWMLLSVMPEGMASPSAVSARIVGDRTINSLTSRLLDSNTQPGAS